MATKNLIPLLITGMLISGVCNTILNKFQDMQCVANCLDPDPSKHHYFEQPVWQTLNMFIGETLCLIATYSIMIFRGFYPTKSVPILQNSSNSAVQDGDLDEESDEPNKQLKIIVHGKERFVMSRWQPMYFFFPALFDICGTTLMNVGLLYTSASIYQMTRGALVLWVGLFSVLFLKRHLKLYEWMALFTVMLGVSIVGLSGVLVQSKTSEKDNFNGKMDHLQLKTTQSNEAALAFFGVLIVLLAQIFTASQFVVEEKIMEHFSVEPLLAVGYEGVFGLLTTLIGMPILYYFFGHDGNFFDLKEGFKQIFEYPQVWVTGIAIAFSIAFFNFFGLSVTRSVSATARSTIDTCRTLFIWLVSLYLGWEKFAWLQVLGFVVLVYGTFIYTKVIRPPGFISSRSTEETQLLLAPEEEDIESRD